MINRPTTVVESREVGDGLRDSLSAVICSAKDTMKKQNHLSVHLHEGCVPLYRFFCCACHVNDYDGGTYSLD